MEVLSVDEWFADWLQGEDIPADELPKLGNFERVEDSQWKSEDVTYVPFVCCRCHSTVVLLANIS